MNPRTALRLVAIAPALAPQAAAACAVCADTAWGQRGFGWPFVALMLAPFVLLAALAGALAWGTRRGARAADEITRP